MHTFNAMVTLQVKCLGNVGLRVGVKVKKKKCNWNTKPGGSAERTKEEDLLVSSPSKPLTSYLVLLFLFDKLMGPSHCIPT